MPKLTIVQLGDIPEEVLTAVGAELRETYGLATETTQPMEIDKEILNHIRRQYPGPLVLKFLKAKFPGRVLGIMTEDLYAENLNFILGQAYFGGSDAIISILRLNPSFYGKKEDDKTFVERAVKEAVHEVGHMAGLEHCPNQDCVMNFSNTAAEVDRKTKNLCSSCKKSFQI
jgi:archaemetzincin